ncbi:MAG: hypothetical protein V4644_01845 [Patescibacteria group bacterium]
MHTRAAAISMAAALIGTHAMAQQPYLSARVGMPSGMPIHDPVMIVPAFDPKTQVVAFRAFAFNVEDSDIPFFIDRRGTVIDTADRDAFIEAQANEDDIVVFLCTKEEGGRPPDMNDPAYRRRYCTIERYGRQP